MTGEVQERGGRLSGRRGRKGSCDEDVKGKK